MVCPLAPVVEIACHDNRFTVRQRVGPFGQHFQLRLTMGFAQAQMNAADVDGQLKVGRGNAAVEQAAFFALPDGNVAVFIMFNGITRQHRVAVMTFRIDRVAAVGVIAPHGVGQKFIVRRVGPVLKVKRMYFVCAHHLLQADNIRADGAHRVAQLR
ncbi:Uncharacterised protein [Klebsiella pneumoniae]|nr:Uncharacterised protein [Klebsiella pneumoniae]